MLLLLGRRSGEDVEGEVVLDQRHEDSLTHDERDVHADERQETDGGLEARVPARKLETQGDEVHRDEEGGTCSC